VTARPIEPGGFTQGHRHRLLNQDVLARFERSRRDRPVLKHRGGDQDEIDVGALDNVLESRLDLSDVELFEDERTLLFFGIAGNDDLNRSVEAQEIDGVYVGARYYLPTPDHPDPHRICACQNRLSAARRILSTNLTSIRIFTWWFRVSTRRATLVDKPGLRCSIDSNLSSNRTGWSHLAA
jgi:hypothetical protein